MMTLEELMALDEPKPISQEMQKLIEETRRAIKRAFEKIDKPIKVRLRP
jgi:hypothetical protein